MQKLFEIAWKELKFIKTQRLSLLLIILYPLIIVFSLGAAFSQANIGELALQDIDLAMYVPTGSDNFDSESFVSEIENSARVNLLLQNTPEAAKEAIRLGWAKVGLVVYEPETDKSNIEVDMYYDNTSLLESQTIAQYSASALQLIAYQKSAKILNEMWANLDDIREKIYSEMQKTNEFILKLDALQAELSQMEQKINSIDLSRVKGELDSFDYYYGEGKNEISGALSDTIEAKDTLVVYRTSAVNARDNLIYYRDRLIFIKGKLDAAYPYAPTMIRSQISQSQSEVNSLITQMNTTIAELDQVIIDIDSTHIKLGEIEIKLQNADSMLEQSMARVSELKVTVSNLESTINEVKVFLEEAEESRWRISRDLTQTKGMLGGLVQTLDEFRGYDPAYIAKPIIIHSLPMYDVKDLAVMIPIAISIVLLLTCMLLTSISVISEKNQGINLRVQLSPTKKITWLSGKIIGQMVFGLAIAAVISVIAVTVFHTPMPENIPLYLLVLVSITFSFICTGVFLTNFIKTQTNAILASLLLLVPMLFLSGTLFPIQFMPPMMRGIASSLPLTVANNLILGTVIRGASFWLLFPGMASLVGLGIALLVFTNFYKKE